MLRGSRRWISFENICISVRIAASNGRGSPLADAIKNGKRCRIVTEGLGQNAFAFPRND